MRKITRISKRDIFDLFNRGFYTESFFEGKKHFIYRYNGRLNELEFLNKLYPLKELPSNDSKCYNMEDEIWQHTINNEDWDDGWIFEDKRLELFEGDDYILLDTMDVGC